LIVLHNALPVPNGLGAGQVKEMVPAVKLVYLTMNPNANMAAEPFRRGASYLLNSQPSVLHCRLKLGGASC